MSIRADIVLTYTIKPVLYGSLASWLASVPLRIGITTGLGNTFNRNNATSKLVRFLYKHLLKFSSEVWFLNEDDASTFLKEKLVQSKKIFLLPGEGVDIDHFTPVDPKPGFNFTLVSRMLWDKGVGIFVEAARIFKKSHPDSRFILVGPVDSGNPEGISLEQLKLWSQEGVLEYTGPIDDVREVLKETSCLVHPTYYKEGLPRILLEACAMGVPCITTDIPGCRDVIIEGINGFLISMKSQRSLVDAMSRFVALSIQERKRISSSSRDLICKKFSSEYINSIYLKKLSL